MLLSDAEPDAVVVNPTRPRDDAEGEGVRQRRAPGHRRRVRDAADHDVGTAGDHVEGDAAGSGAGRHFGTGATLFVREAVNVRISDADQDDFIRNRLTMLGEGRFGLAIWQPTAFAIVHLA